MVVSVGKSNSGHVWSSPASVLLLYGFSLIHLLLRILNYWSVIGTDTFYVHRISLISGNISWVAIKSKNLKFFHRVLKYNHWWKPQPKQIAQSITTYFLCSKLIVANVHKGAAKLSAAVEEGDSSEVVAEQETRGDPSFLSFPSSLGLPPSICLMIWYK